jgi:hypothetical protein
VTQSAASSFTDEIDGAVSDLLNVPGIGKATAAAMRASGELQSVADLRNVCSHVSRPCAGLKMHEVAFAHRRSPH